MSKSKAVTRRAPVQQSIAYTIWVSMISPSIFGSYLYMNWGATTADVPMLVSMFLFIFLACILIAMEKEGALDLGFNDYQTLDKSLCKSNSLLSPLVNKSLAHTNYYYPGLNTYISPLFSLPTFINFRVIIFVLPTAVAALVMTGNFFLVAKLTALALICCWVFLVALNLKPIFKVLINRGREELRTINMAYSIETMREMLGQQTIIYHKDEQKDKDLFELLYMNGHLAATEINDLIASKHTTAAMIENEVKTIEHIINYFVPTTINTTKKFFSKYKNKHDAALTIYMRDAAPKIRKEALELYTKVHAVHDTIRHMKSAQRALDAIKIKEQRLIDEDSIKIDMELLALTEKTVLPINEFPEFHRLNFKNTEKRVAAQNIVSVSLIQLVEAKNKVSSPTEKQNLDIQIERVKTFVKSLASDTPESIERQSRIIAKEKADTLYLGVSSNRINDVDHIIGINERYITSYDNTLPIND